MRLQPPHEVKKVKTTLRNALSPAALVTRLPNRPISQASLCALAIALLGEATVQVILWMHGLVPPTPMGAFAVAAGVGFGFLLLWAGHCRPMLGATPPSEA